jgi:hypothetical protein
VFPFTGASPRTANWLARIFLLATIALGATLGIGWMKIRRMMLALPPDPPRIDQRQTAPSRPVSPLLLQYRLDVPGRGEIFPALAAASAADYWPAAILSITNTADQPALQVVRSEIAGYSRTVEHTLIIGPKQTLTVPIVPDLLPSAFSLQEIVRAPLAITVTNEDGSFAYARTQSVLLHSGSDLYWGKQFANAQLVARWVTPHDPAVLQLVSSAHRFIANGRMPGYNINERNARNLPAQVTAQAQAIFRAIQDSGFAYVSSIFTFGSVTESAQRIRLPRETLSLDSANCMDISVAFASAIENIGLQPVIVIVPGHAFAGVRLGPGSSDILYLDLTVLPRGTFEQARARAENWRKKIPAEQVLTVDVISARRMRIYPLPTPDAPTTPVQPVARSQSGS